MTVGTLPPSTGYSPYTIQSTGPTVPSASPQAPPNMLLDGIQIGASSLIVGRLASKTAMQKFDISTIEQGELSTKGVVMTSALKTARNAALVSGVISTGRNVYHLAKGEINVSRASGNVGADIIGGTVGGLVAGIGSGFTIGALAGHSALAMGTAGLIAGAVGFAVVDSLYRFTGLHDQVSDKITDFIDRFLNKNPAPGGV